VSRNRLVLNGMAEFRAALRNLPETLAGEAAHIVEGAANGAAADVKRRYPIQSGHLVGGVQVTHFDNGRVAAGAIVKSGAKHSHLYEYGTRRRQTAKGANRGAMPKASDATAMIPAIVRARKRMYAELADLLRRAGFQVTGV
jgi:hypothetical protein